MQLLGNLSISLKIRLRNRISDGVAIHIAMRLHKGIVVQASLSKAPLGKATDGCWQE
jgi:hypothetical protein